MLDIIENDDLENFKTIFNIEHWRDSITTIANYAGVSQYIKEVTYNEADCLKYALHCNADKIFYYLLPLLDTEKHGDNYGWPLLSMAIKNNRYDYALEIINHPSFNPYPRYHNNCFMYIESHTHKEKHIDFLFKYLEKFDPWDFQDQHLVYNFTHLVCYNEETFARFNDIYKQKNANQNVSVLDMYSNYMNYLGDEIFNRKFNSFIIKKLDMESIGKIITASYDKEIYFVRLFESKHAIEGINYLLQCPELFKVYFDNNEIIISYLPLEGILLLMDNGIDIWKNNSSNANAIDYILDNDNMDDEATSYFINNYTQQIYDRLHSKNRNNNILKYCHQKLLAEKLIPKSYTKTVNSKI